MLGEELKFFFTIGLICQARKLYAQLIMRFVIGLLFACSCVRYTQANHHPFTPPWTEWEGSQVKGVRMFDKDIYKSGHYFFYGCTQEQAESLQGTFKTLGHVISSQVIPEFSRGKPSRYGFSTWFGRNGPGEVLEVYSRIRDGYAEPAQSSNDMNPRQWRPEFVCYDRNMPDYPQAFLESIGTHCSSSTHTSFTLPLTSIVWLCPRLFARPALPDFKPVGRCQLLNGRGTRFAGTTPQIFYNSKAMTLVETMASKYKKVLNTKPPRSRDMNFLANLPDEQKLNAAVNYALYAQCEPFPAGVSLASFSFLLDVIIC